MDEILKDPVLLSWMKHLFSVVWRSGQYLWSGIPGYWFSSDRGIKLLSLLGKFNSGPALVGLLRGVIWTLCPERTVGGPDEAPGPILRAVRSESCVHTFLVVVDSTWA